MEIENDEALTQNDADKGEDLVNRQEFNKDKNIDIKNLREDDFQKMIYDVFTVSNPTPGFIKNVKEVLSKDFSEHFGNFIKYDKDTKEYYNDLPPHQEWLIKLALNNLEYPRIINNILDKTSLAEKVNNIEKSIISLSNLPATIEEKLEKYKSSLDSLEKKVFLDETTSAKKIEILEEIVTKIVKLNTDITNKMEEMNKNNGNSLALKKLEQKVDGIASNRNSVANLDSSKIEKIVNNILNTDSGERRTVNVLESSRDLYVKCLIENGLEGYRNKTFESCKKHTIETLIQNGKLQKNESNFLKFNKDNEYNYTKNKQRIEPFMYIQLQNDRCAGYLKYGNAIGGRIEDFECKKKNL